MKKKIIIVPGTHWDREWYFTQKTSDILLQRLYKEMEEHADFKYTLDGQASLLENILESEPLTPNVKRELDNGNLRIGPLYSQPDVFNSSFGTTHYNLKIGKEMTQKFTHLPKTIFMPDTFGFNEQLPQIFNLHGYKQFVFWRGITPEDIQKSNLFHWKGLNNSQLLCSLMSKGYNVLADFYPWDRNQKSTGDQFQDWKDAIYKMIKLQESYTEQNIYWIPFAGDQLPFPKKLPTLVQLLNAQGDYDFSIGHHDDYFAQIHDAPDLPSIDYAPYYSGTSKIHRTIHSNRTDIKRASRTIERNLYYRMEQVEMMYTKFGGKPLSRTYKMRNIYKPLIESSAHDSLGGGNSDTTNEIILHRLTDISTLVQSYIDLMVRDIRTGMRLKNDEYVIFNFAPFEQDLIFDDIISTTTTQEINYSDGELEILEFQQDDLSFAQHHTLVINHHVKIWAKKMAPFSWRVWKIQSNKKTETIGQAVSFIAENINIKLDKKVVSFRIYLDENLGDEFDFSTNSKVKTTYAKNFILKTIKILPQTAYYQVESMGEFAQQNYHFTLKIFVVDQKIDVVFETTNDLKNARISLEFASGVPLLSRHLAFIQQKLDNIPDWEKRGFFDKPVNHYTNDGLVQLTDGLKVLTLGNNEVEIIPNKIRLVIARFSPMIGKIDLDFRPGIASGLPFKEYTPMAQLNKPLRYEFRFEFNPATQALNEWMFVGYGAQVVPTNLTHKKTDRFALNFPQLTIQKVHFPVINHSEILVGIYNDEDVVLANPTDKHIGGYNPFEIRYLAKHQFHAKS